jgi:CBS domain-containing protein
MPYQVQQLIEGKGMPVCVTKDDTVTKALSLMIEHDFSQLPVVKKENNFDLPEGMITYEGILRGIRNFKAKIEDLKVRDVMVDAPGYSLEDDLFDILDRLKVTNAVLVTDVYGSDLVGIVTSYDTTEYFRDRTEDLMHVEDVELMIKDFIRAAYSQDDGDLDESKLNKAIAQVTVHKNANDESEKIISFEDLSLSDYIGLLLRKETWTFFDPIFGVQRSFVNELLQGIREIRNALAHFRGNISADQRDKLKFGVEWLSRCQDEYQALRQKQEISKVLEIADVEQSQSIGSNEIVASKAESSTDFSITESATGGGRYAALADWLQSQPGSVSQVQLTFDQIEEIINNDLPPSAREHRAWWANDTVGHSHSQQWLEAGWRRTYLNLSESKVVFNRIRERERAYIAFFSKLLDELRKKSDFPVRDVSPDGASWIVIQTLPRSGTSFGSFTFSFTRDKHLRVELYLDLGDQEQTKAAFDKLIGQRGQIEGQVGTVAWERLNSRRASRIALYHEGQISEEKKQAELRKWAVESMIKFYNALVEPAEKAILEVKNG